MRKSITINILEPCHEDWSKMTPKEQGRHCDACSKTVTDFTKKTDEQIIKTIEANGKLCGRFKTQQLNREIVLARKDKNNYMSWAASGLFAFMALGNQDMHAQGKPKTVKVDSIKVSKLKGKMKASIFTNRIISGVVYSRNDSFALPGVSIIIRGTKSSVETDLDGKFSLQIKEGQILEFRHLGFDSKQMRITRTTNDTIKINLENSFSGEAISVSLGGAIVQSVSIVSEESTLSKEGIVSRIKRRKVSLLNWQKRNKARRTKWKAERLSKRKSIKNGEQERSSLGKFFFRIKSLFSKK